MASAGHSRFYDAMRALRRTWAAHPVNNCITGGVVDRSPVMFLVQLAAMPEPWRLPPAFLELQIRMGPSASDALPARMVVVSEVFELGEGGLNCNCGIYKGPVTHTFKTPTPAEDPEGCAALASYVRGVQEAFTQRARYLQLHGEPDIESVAARAIVEEVVQAINVDVQDVIVGKSEEDCAQARITIGGDGEGAPIYMLVQILLSTPTTRATSAVLRGAFPRMHRDVAYRVVTTVPTMSNIRRDKNTFEFDHGFTPETDPLVRDAITQCYQAMCLKYGPRRG